MGAWALCLLLLLLPQAGWAQPEVAPTRNPAGLAGSFDLDELLTSDPVASALFPPSIIRADTAIAIRHALVLAVVAYNLNTAGCDPAGVALDFWGERRQLSQEVCTTLARLEAGTYANLRAIELEFPEIASALGALMAANGYDPEDRSMNMSTSVGAGNALGVRVAQFFASDGWNSLGDLTRERFRQPFEDTSGYRPVNSPWKVEYPLRWQPLTQHTGNGRYATQSHVVPFLGGMTPLALSAGEFQSRRSPAPYADINAKDLTSEDADTVKRLARDLFDVSANSTFQQRFEARWFEFKALSLGAFVIGHAREFGWTIDDMGIISRWGLGEMMAQHDAILLAWKEKVRYDAVRPDTVIRTMFSGERVTVWVDAATGASEIAAEDWEPLIPTQPHSEYPSASAAVCNASAQHADLLLRELKGEVTPVARFTFDDASLGDFIDMEGRVVTVEYQTYQDVAEACGRSRLWAGVHFGPSVPAGWALADGVGRAAYEHVRDLVNGRKPEHCVRCA